MESCKTLIDKKNHRVTLKVAADPSNVYGDRVRLALLSTLSGGASEPHIADALAVARKWRDEQKRREQAK